jgi:mannose-6-phosphate isomerase-like protein (cupin superfamily)
MMAPPAAGGYAVRMRALLMPIGFLVLIASPQAGIGAEPAKPAIVDLGSAEHYVWGEVNDGWYLVNRADLSVIRERMPGGARETPHFHRKARQFFQVLRGTLTVRIDGVDTRVGEGQGIEIPPGTPHQAINAGRAPIEFLVVSAPNSHGDRVDVPEGPAG